MEPNHLKAIFRFPPFVPSVSHKRNGHQFISSYEACPPGLPSIAAVPGPVFRLPCLDHSVCVLMPVVSSVPLSMQLTCDTKCSPGPRVSPSFYMARGAVSLGSGCRTQCSGFVTSAHASFQLNSSAREAEWECP